MINILLIVLTAIFIIESIFEVRYFAQIRTIFNQSGRAQPTKRIQRIIMIETQWSWISWIFLLLLFVLPNTYTAILICIITFIETWVVYELYNAREYAQKINKK
ncbi:hypothetical protein FOD75_05685 [Limosilactobacillus reuteri]|uniref:Uncharacterized protein n=1 Tax=Limosilactobacillus reuteri TaxID=1598 RepID=A0A517D5I7_LIMRT|nr:hypothetical protein [Limosilactobacillus reuteri]QDR72606.1 hypothetical protein FOD75_05685 [Limosilactobacillus reuteri]